MKKVPIGIGAIAAVLLALAFTPAGDDFGRLAKQHDDLVAQLAQFTGDKDKRAAEIAADKQRIADLQAQLNALSGQPKKAADQAPGKFKRGGKRTPIPKVIEAIRTGKLGVHKTNGKLPASITMIPPNLTMLGNDQYGDCVTAESCFSMEAFSVYSGLPEIVITNADAVAWANAHGVLNGADLLQVIQMMEQDGIKDSTGKVYKSGTPSTVDFSNEAILQSAIVVGPVSIGIDANALPGGAGNSSGWFSFGGKPGQFSNEDHDVDVCGFGDAKTLFAALGTPVPAGAPAGTLYLVYTWSTIGVVDHAWIMSTVGEAYVRTPTVVGLTPVTPPPPPVPVTVSVADVIGVVGQPVTFLPIASGGVGPYKFGFDYGDGSKDGTGVHTYAGAGAYNVTVTAADSSGLFGVGKCVATVGSTPQPPTPSAPQITLKGISPDADGDWYLLRKALGDRRIIDVLNQQTPERPVLTPAQRDALQQLLQSMGKK